MAYLLKAGMIYMLCFTLYWLLFRKETFFRRNRIFLLMSLVMPAIIPLIQLPGDPSTGGLAAATGMKWVVVINNVISQSAPADTSPVQPVIADQGFNLNTGTILISIYIIGLIFFLIRMLANYSGIIILIARSERKRLHKMILAITSGKVSPFSIFKWLVIPKSRVNHPDLDKIIQHEIIHYGQKHSVDLLLTELLIVFQWFNPFAWMLKSAVIRNNEFLVDHILLSGQSDHKAYQYALLASSVGEQKLAMVNRFNKGLIKKRIQMMNKKRTRMVNRIKDILILPFSVVVVMAFSAYTNNVSEELPGQERSIVRSENAWSVSKNEGRKIVEGELWTLPQDQDKDKKKKKGEKDHIKIFIDGEMVMLKGATALLEKDGDIKVYSISGLEDLDGKDITRELLIERLGKIKSDDEHTLVLMKDSDDGGDSAAVYVVGVDGSSSDKKGIIYLEKDEGGHIKIGTSEGKGKILYIVESDDDSKKIHIRTNGKGDNDLLILIDGKISTEEDLKNLDSDKIYSITILDSDDAVKEYGEKAKDGVLKVTTKK
jgi:hypothetical protein